jgi:hypothetical protein
MYFHAGDLGGSTNTLYGSDEMIHARDIIKPAGSRFVSESSSIITVIGSVLVDHCLV